MKYSDKGTIEIKLVNETAFSVEILVKKGEWVGIGYGRSMRKCDMNAINSFINGTFEVIDLYSFREEPPMRDINIGGNDDLKEIKNTDEGEFIRLYYTRLLDTGDQYDKKIEAVFY